MSSIIYDIDNVTYQYDHSVPALKGLSLRIEQGERVALLGANGSGKSTLLRLMDALCFADTGEVRFDGQRLYEDSLRNQGFQLTFRRRVGLVFQNADVQVFNPTVFDEVAFGPLQLGWPKEKIRSRVLEALESMRIAHLKDRAPHRLSGGEKKRVALASVLICDPDVLLLDEPTGGLDPKSQSQIIDLLSTGHDGNKTFVTATHDLNIVEDIADKCHILDAGRVVASGTPQDLLADVDLLQRTSLIHAHRHTHGGEVHSHPHMHGHGHHGH